VERGGSELKNGGGIVAQIDLTQVLKSSINNKHLPGELKLAGKGGEIVGGKKKKTGAKQSNVSHFSVLLSGYDLKG